jgi:tetratricopeptide (TPR) repeat protein
LIIASAYSHLGINAEAKYYFDRILTEHPDNKFAKLAMIYIGDEKSSNGDNKNAIKLYKDALYQTSDIKIASVAASRLAYKFLEQGNKVKAQEFYEKVLRANPKYLVKSEFDGYKLAKELADKELYIIAKEIGDIIITKIGDNKLHDIYENVLKDTAYWFEMDKSPQRAYDLYHRYLNEFPFGDFISFVNTRLDYLFFDMPDSNQTKMLAKYDELIERYGVGDIASKALYNKAKLLFDMKKYQDILNLKEKILAIDEDIAPDKNDTVNSAGVQLAIEFLKEKRCTDAVKLKREYNISFSNDYDKDLAYCALKTTDYRLAIDLAERNLNRISDKNEKLDWTKLYFKALIDELDLYKAIDVGRGLIKLSVELGDTAGEKSIYDIFKAYMKLKKYDEAKRVSDEIEKRFVNDFHNIDTFKALVNLASKNGDNEMLLKYAKKIIDLQNMYSSYVESPQIELSYMNTLMNINRVQDAIDFGKDIKNLDDENKIRFKYLVGTAYQKLEEPELAKSTFEDCVNIKAESSWKSLCENSLKLMNY